MDDSYLHAETPEERLGIAIEACNELYSKAHPTQAIRWPPRTYYKEYLKAFLDRELANARLEELHKGAKEVVEVRQRELIEQINKANEEIARIFNIRGTS